MNRPGFLVLAVLLCWPTQASGEWQLKPFLGLTFGGNTTFLVDLEEAIDEKNLAIGGSVVRLGEIIGLEADFSFAPGFFQSGDQQLIARSGVLTLTGNVVVAMPKRLARYTLRPYIAAGAGLMRVRVDDTLTVIRLRSNLVAMDVGGGATGFVTERIGVSWDVRYFRNISGKNEGQGLSFGDPRLSFWRASMAFVIRY